MKIYLIGMPGAGKSTLGVQLAKKLLLQFLDLDKLIEELEGSSIAELFSRKGEDYFRMKEAETLARYASGAESFVMATGGGAPCFYNGIDTLNSTGVTVFLDVRTEVLIERLARKTDRPLLQNEGMEELKKKIATLKEKRLPIYKKATITVENPSIEKVWEKLIHLKSESEG